MMKKPDYYVNAFDMYLYSLYIYKYKVLLQNIKNNISDKRMEHCIRVAQASIHFANRFFVNVENAFLVGIAHDICRENDISTLLKLSNSNNSKKIIKIKDEDKLLLHGRVARIVLEKIYPLPQSVYDAIATHTLGVSNPTPLQKIIYLTDALDYKRDIWINEEYMYSNIYKSDSLDLALLQLITFLKQKFSIIHKVTQEMFDSIKREI